MLINLILILIMFLNVLLQLPSTQQEWLTVSDAFNAKWKFPHAIGAIDGKHVAIKAPAKSGKEYYNYKQFFSILLLAVADADFWHLGYSMFRVLRKTMELNPETTSLIVLTTVYLLYNFIRRTELTRRERWDNEELNHNFIALRGLVPRTTNELMQIRLHLANEFANGSI